LPALRRSRKCEREEEHREFVAELREAWDNRAVPIQADNDRPRRTHVNEGIAEQDR
jgi:hypothetical protein